MTVNDGKLQANMVVRLPSKEIAWVEYVTASAARIHYISRFEKPITTRKGVTKMVMARRPPVHISPGAVVEILDPELGYVQRIQEDMMSETQTQEAPAQEKPAPARAQQIYVRTDKVPEKEPRGQAAIVLDALNRMKQGTLSDVTRECAGKFTGSRQSDDRVVGFYLSQFKRKGLVSTSNTPVVGEAEAEASAEAAE
jgi:hypothetical protein